MTPDVAAKPSRLDSIGLCASLLCTVHCLVMPLVLAAQPMFVWLRTSRKVDNTLLAISAAVGLIGCLLTVRQHRDFGPLTLLFVGLATVGFGRFFAWPPIIIAGPLLMSYGLWLNRRLCSCATCHY